MAKRDAVLQRVTSVLPPSAKERLCQYLASQPLGGAGQGPARPAAVGFRARAGLLPGLLLDAKGYAVGNGGWGVDLDAAIEGRLLEALGAHEARGGSGAGSGAVVVPRGLPAPL